MSDRSGTSTFDGGDRDVIDQCQRHPRFVRTADSHSTCRTCPLCGQDSHLCFVKEDYPIRGCRVCGHQFADYVPPPSHTDVVYGDQYFTGGGAGYADYLAEAELLRARGRRYARLLHRWITPPGRLLDVGAAAGFLLAGFCDQGWTGEGVEPNERMATHARTVLGLSVEATTLEAAQLDRHYDLVSFIQVVAHFPDPLKAFQRADQLTRPGGFWLIETWNSESLTARILGQNWHEYSPPSVLHWFSRRSLRRVLLQLGYRQVGIGTLGKWLNAGHAKSLLQHKLAGTIAGRLVNRVATLFPDHLVIPYPSEDLFWAVFQKCQPRPCSSQS